MKARKPVPILQIFLCAALIGAFAGFISLLPRPDGPREQAVIEAIKGTFQAKVITVSDGDTMTVRSGTVRSGDQNIKIRLAQIDAPERDQPWGSKSRQALAALVKDKTVIISPQDTDRYGRIIAQVSFKGKDVNAAMIEQGAAWAYRDYLRDPSLITLESNAKSARLGLWAMPDTQIQPPWEYRAQRREAAGVSVGR
jgi:endonuclease YncB( thermonuclease family)